jgi:hypothetical protein
MLLISKTIPMATNTMPHLLPPASMSLMSAAKYTFVMPAIAKAKPEGIEGTLRILCWHV